ncbi:MAG: urea carboxylase-associated family protein [Gammaproteobacteria bacterium]|nr:urea carboxylase-associated family protein [Gammaproteobacteria bacterium]
MTRELNARRIVYTDRLSIASSWSFVVRRGYTLRIIDSKGGANCGLLAYNNDDRLERYNMADTLKAQHTALLTKGHVLYSDMGRILFSITEDSCGWHDTLGGTSDASSVKEAYGENPYQENLNSFYRNGRELFLIELGKYGLGKRDIVANVNLFSKVTVNHNGAMLFESDNSKAGNFVDLRAEMNVLVVLNNCQHPLDPDPRYRPGHIEMLLWKSDPVTEADFCRNHCAENQRGFFNTENYFYQSVV